MTVSLIVPFRGDFGRRDVLWTWCKEHWTWRYPEFELVECDSGDVPFTRGRSINRGVEKASGDILVLADADTLVAHVDAAIAMAQERAWVIAYPQGMYYALSEKATDELLATDPRDELREPTKEQWRQKITSYSGVLVVPRDVFEIVGGFDERFFGWGAEDLAFMWALDTLWGFHRRATGWATALYHPHVEAERFEAPEWPANNALCKRYEDRYCNRSAMRDLVRER